MLEGAAASPLGEPLGIQAGDHEQEPFQVRKRYLSACVCVRTATCTCWWWEGEGEGEGALTNMQKDWSPMPSKLSGCHSKVQFSPPPKGRRGSAG